MEKLGVMEWVVIIAGLIPVIAAALPFKTEWKESAIYKGIVSLFSAIGSKK